MSGTVLVTGGTVRLGLAIASHLREKGWKVFTTSHRPEASADYLVDFRQRWELPKFDAVVNNAAIFTGSPAEMMLVNYLAPKRVIEEQIAQNIVNILDSRVLSRHPAKVDAYFETKARLLDLTLRHHPGTRVNAVAPGPVLAPVGVAEKAGPTPFGRPTPEAVAAAVRFLLETPFVSGCVVPVDGGQHLL